MIYNFTDNMKPGFANKELRLPSDSATKEWSNSGLMITTSLLEGSYDKKILGITESVW